MHLSHIGSIASQYWIEIPKHFPHVRLDEFVIMPNHLHGILILDYSCVGARHGVPLHQVHNTNLFSKPIKNSVSVIVNQFKSSVKRWCNNNGYKDFEWQPRFYDHIMYDECSIQNIRVYIKNNPSNWQDNELFI